MNDDIDRILRDLPAEEPPASLHRDIMAGIELPEPAARVRGHWLSAFGVLPALRYGGAAVAGFLVAAMIFRTPSLLDGAIDEWDVAGTMATDGVRSDPELLDYYDFDEGSVRGLVQLRSAEDALMLDIQFVAEEPVDIEADLSRAGLRPGTLSQFYGALQTVEISDESLKIRGNGRQRLIIELRNRDDAEVAGEATIGLVFSSNGRLLQQGTLAPTS